MIERTKSASGTPILRPAPEPGAMSFMMSKQGYLGDDAGHWHPHLMFFLAPHRRRLPGARILTVPRYLPRRIDPEPITTFFVPVPKWSDGTPADMKTHSASTAGIPSTPQTARHPRFPSAGESCFQLVERPRPSSFVATARLLVMQQRMGECELGALRNDVATRSRRATRSGLPGRLPSANS